ncbi:MAG: hypothetical protein Q9168_006004 [Polycauliona sp. 1 TL-2023]
MIGAVKTNISHSEATSSLSAVIKECLVVEEGMIPPTKGIAHPSEIIEWKNMKCGKTKTNFRGARQQKQLYLIPFWAHDKPTLKRNMNPFMIVVLSKFKSLNYSTIDPEERLEATEASVKAFKGSKFQQADFSRDLDEQGRVEGA